METSHPVLYVMLIAVAAAVFSQIPTGLRLQAAVVEMVLGIVIGPQVLGLLSDHGLVHWLGNAGLAALFFMSGFDLDLGSVRGRPLRLAIRGWMLSLLLGLAAGVALAGLTRTGSPLLVGLALTTTALGTLMPVLRDTDQLRTRFGSYVVAAGAVGEFGPVMVMSLMLTQGSRATQAGLMLAFVAIAFLAAFLALRVRPPRLVEFLGSGMHSSTQLPVRLSMLLLVCLSVLSERFGLETVLGAFAAGMVVSLSSRGEAGKLLHEKMDAISFGFFVPFFFVTSGMNIDIRALFGSARAMLFVPLFLVLFLVVRGLPTLLYSREIDKRDRPAFAFYAATTLPMVVALTQVGVKTGRMQTFEAAALSGAALLSVLLFPAIAGKLRPASAESQTDRAA